MAIESHPLWSLGAVVHACSHCVFVCMLASLSLSLSLSLPLSCVYCRSEVDPDSPLHEAEARRLFEGMLQALSDVRT